MAAGSKSRKRKSYRVANWREYNESLVRRGDITFWFSEDVIAAWEHDNAEVRRGRPFVYSDLAIETLLTIRELFRLPYRQTEGLGRALAKLMGADVPIPHHTSLVKRAAKLDVSIQLTEARGQVDVVVDSTGLKVYGEGEWKVRQHGADKRRDWRKVHLAVDPDSHTILAELTTSPRTHDATAALSLLEAVDAELQTVYGDGAYDQQKVYDALEHRQACAIIAPRKNAVISERPDASWDRNEAIRQIDRHGREAWKDTSGYHRRSLGETAMSRLKGAFGERLKSREPPQQNTEVALRCKLLNWFVILGMPISMMI
ncbi:MAG: IS5 family transposase [Planctomycetes bacterium]|nr:IS5 family transposase [Planctomycetota bacterium]